MKHPALGARGKGICFKGESAGEGLPRALMHQVSLTTQPWVSGAEPRWMATRRSFSLPVI